MASHDRGEPVQLSVIGRAGGSLPQVVAIGFRDDLPAIAELHGHQIVGEIARRQLAAHFYKGGGVVGAVDGDDKILARLALRLGGGTFADASEPVGHFQNLQLAIFMPAQIGGRVKRLADLLGAAFIKAVEVKLNHRFHGRTVVSQGVPPSKSFFALYQVWNRASLLARLFFFGRSHTTPGNPFSGTSGWPS